MNNIITAGLRYSDRLNMALEARHDAIKTLFQSEVAPLTSLMGPMSESPEWPAGAAWLAIRHGNNTGIVSDGLSDPWVERDRPETGLGLEVFIETPDVKLTTDAPLTTLAYSWLFPTIAEISHTLASYPKLCETLLTNAPLSLEFNIEHIKDGRGRVGALLHIPQNINTEFVLPGGQVKLIATTLLTQAELQFLRGKGQVGRCEIRDKLYAADIGHVSLLNRPSVV